MIWSVTENKHEADLIVIYNVIVEIASDLSVESLDIMYANIA